jgi:hypothetical protein
VVFIVGETTIEVPLIAPGFHVYEVAPLAVSVLDAPVQIAVGDATAVTVGFGFTIKETVAEELQDPFRPKTV